MKSCSSVPSIWDAFTIFWADLELCRSRSSLPPRLRPAHFTAVAALGGLPMVQSSPKFWCLCCNWAAPSPTSSPGLSSGTLTMSHGSKPHLPCVAPSFLELLLHLRVCPHQWSLLISHSASPQLVSMVPSCLPNWYHVRNSSYHQLHRPTQGVTLGPTRPQLLADDEPEEPLIRRFHLNDADLFIIPMNF